MLKHALIELLSRDYDWASWAFSLCDRDAQSSEYGCFDRYFWHYRTEREFPSATYQYLILALTCLYLDPNSPWYHRRELKDWIVAGCQFWSKIQRRDGSFDEWLPYEQSHVATAFTTAYITEALLLFSEASEAIDPGPSFWAALDRAGRFLCRHHDLVVLNHMAGAVSALGNLFILTKDQRFRKGCDDALELMKSKQTTEGWFPEYSGADPGYTSVSIDFLAKYWHRSQDERAMALILPALDFLSHFQYPDGSVGGICGSRNTRYLLPHGLVLLNEYPAARQALALWERGQKAGVGVTLNSLDDRYRGFFLSNRLQALLDLQKINDFEKPSRGLDQTVDRYFPQAGLLRAARGEFTLVCGLKKLAVFDLFQGDTLCYTDAGYGLIFEDGECATTQWPDPEAQTRWDPETGHIRTEGLLALQKGPDFFHRALLPHRLISHVLGRLGRNSGAINNRIKAQFVKPARKAPATFKRRIIFEAQSVEIQDSIAWQKPVAKVIHNQGPGKMHVPSSNFYTRNQSNGEVMDARGTAGITITVKINFDGIDRRVDLIPVKS